MSDETQATSSRWSQYKGAANNSFTNGGVSGPYTSNGQSKYSKGFTLGGINSSKLDNDHGSTSDYQQEV